MVISSLTGPHPQIPAEGLGTQAYLTHSAGMHYCIITNWVTSRPTNTSKQADTAKLIEFAGGFWKIIM